jgi:hypothetical protein
MDLPQNLLFPGRFGMGLMDLGLADFETFIKNATITVGKVRSKLKWEARGGVLMTPSMAPRITGNLENEYQICCKLHLHGYKTLKNIDLMPVYGHFVLAMQGKVGIIASQNAGLGRCWRKSLPNSLAGDRAIRQE